MQLVFINECKSCKISSQMFFQCDVFISENRLTAYAADSKGRCQVCRFWVSGSRCQVSGASLPVLCASFQVPGTRQPGTMCQVLWIRCYVKMTKTFILKTVYTLAESANLFYVSTEITDTCRHVFHHAIIFFIQIFKLFIAIQLSHSQFQNKIMFPENKEKISAMQLYYTCGKKP